MGATSDPRKSFAQLNKGLDFLERNDVELVVFGSVKTKVSSSFNIKHIIWVSCTTTLPSRTCIAQLI
jgi:hypothetical protein